MAPAAPVRYRNFGGAALLCAASAAVTLLAVLAVQEHAPAGPAPPAANLPRVTRQQVTVQIDNTSEGCRWFPTSERDGVQVAQCGDRYDSELVVFGKDGASVYHVTVANATPVRAALPGGAANGAAGRAPFSPVGIRPTPAPPVP